MLPGQPFKRGHGPEVLFGQQFDLVVLSPGSTERL